MKARPYPFLLVQFVKGYHGLGSGLFKKNNPLELEKPAQLLVGPHHPRFPLSENKHLRSVPEKILYVIKPADMTAFSPPGRTHRTAAYLQITFLPGAINTNFPKTVCADHKNTTLFRPIRRKKIPDKKLSSMITI